MKCFVHGTRLASVFRFPNHFEIVFEFQYPFKFLAHDSVIIRQQNGDAFHEYGYTTNTVLNGFKSLWVCCMASSMGEIPDVPTTKIPAISSEVT